MRSRHARPGWPRAVSVLALAGALLLSAGSPVSAALGPTVTYLADIGRCFSGRGPANSTVDVYWKDAAGHLKASWADTTDGGGYFYPSQSICDALVLEIGDSIKASFPIQSFQRKLVIPRLVVRGDRGTSLISGDAPAGAEVTLRTDRDYLFYGGLGTEACSTTVTADSHGHFSKSFRNLGEGPNCPAHYKVRGADVPSVAYSNTYGDSIYARSIVPYLHIQIGDSSVVGAVIPGAAVKIQDRKANSILRGTAKSHGHSDGTFVTHFKNGSGSRVSVRYGDSIEGNWAGAQSFVVPELTITADSGGNTIVGHCLAKAPYGLEDDSGGTEYVQVGVTDTNGDTQTMNLGSNVIGTGDAVKLVCVRPGGDQIQRDWSF